LFTRSGSSWKLYSSTFGDDGSWSVLDEEKTHSISVDESLINVSNIDDSTVLYSYAINRRTRRYVGSHLFKEQRVVVNQQDGTCIAAPLRAPTKQAF
jgi:hypothetical protein